jgi:hypothetical protein
MNFLAENVIGGIPKAEELSEEGQMLMEIMGIVHPEAEQIRMPGQLKGKAGTGVVL